MAESNVTIVGRTPGGGIIVESDGVRQTIPPSALENYLKSTGYSRSQVSAPESIDEQIRRGGGGVHSTASGTYEVYPPGGYAEKTNIAINPEAQQSEVIKSVENVSGTKIGMPKANLMEAYKLQSQAVINQAVFNAVNKTGSDVMLTPQEYNYQIRIYQELRKQALNPTAADVLGYAVYDPFMLKTLSAGADAYFQGKSKQERAEVMFESGMLAYKLQSYYDPKGAAIQSALGGFQIALVGTAPMIFKSPIIRIGGSVLGLGSGTYNIITEAQTGELKFSSTFVNLATIGLSSAGIYSGFNEISQKKLIDPILKDLDVRQYHEITIERTQYIPKYGTEITYQELKGEEKFLRIGELRKGDILGFPQENPMEIKPYDLGVEIKMLSSERGMAEIKTFTFKVTDKGFEALGEINLDRFNPSLKSDMFRMLEQHPIEYNFDVGFGEKLKIISTKPSVTFLDINDESIRNILSLKFIGLEKPVEWKPDILMKSPTITEKIIKMSGDAFELKDLKDLFSDMRIKDLRGLTPVIDTGTGSITTQETLLAEKSTAIDFIKVTTMSRPINVEILRTPFNINVGVVPISLEKVSFRTNLDIKSMMETKLQEKVSSVNVNQIKAVFENKLIEIERVSPISGIKSSQSMATRTEIGTRVRFDVSPVTVFKPQSYIKDQFKVKQPEEEFKFKSKAVSPSKIIILSEFKKPKILEVSSFLKPTAGLVSLERAFAKFNRGSLARGKDIEKVFRNLSRSSGLALEFPAAEFIRGGRRK